MKWTGVVLSPKTPGKPYRAWIKAGDEVMWLGRYATHEEAIAVADFARYMLFGVDVSLWEKGERHYLPRKPNLPPCGNETVRKKIPVNVIYHKLFRCGRLDRGTFLLRLFDYNSRASRAS